MNTNSTHLFHSIVLTLLLSAVPLAQADQDLHISDNENRLTSHPDWMKFLPDSIKLCAITIPGTHDTGSDNWGSPMVSPFLPSFGGAQTQSLSFYNQLLSGIRYFDLRCHNIGNGTVWIMHGDYYMDHTLADVLFACATFLGQYPTETILLDLQQYKGDPDAGLTDSIKNRLQAYEPLGLIWPAAGLNRPDGQPTTTAEPVTYLNKLGAPVQENLLLHMPTLGEVRGRMVILHDDATTDDMQAMGYLKTTPLFDVWDKYGLGGNGDHPNVNDKWPADEGRFGKIENFIPKSKFQMTGINKAYSDPAYIAIYSPYDNAEFMNRQLLNYLLVDSSSRHGQNLGIVMMDYPGPALIDSLIALNFKYAENQQNLAFDFGQYAINTVRDLPNSLSLQVRADNLRRIFNQLVPAKEINTVLFKNFRTDIPVYPAASTSPSWNFETVVADGDSDVWVYTFASDRLPGKSIPYTSEGVRINTKAWVDSKLSSGGVIIDAKVIDPNELKLYLAGLFPALDWKVIYSATQQFLPVTGTHTTSSSLSDQSVSARYARALANVNGAIYAAQWDVIGLPKGGLAQTIDFPPLPDTTVSAATMPPATLLLKAVASSGLAVTYTSSNVEVAEVSGTTLLLKKPGSVTIYASQTGNSAWYPAKDAFRTLTVNPFVALSIQGDKLAGIELQIENSGDLNLYVQQSVDLNTWEALPSFERDGVTYALNYGLLGWQSGADELVPSNPSEQVPLNNESAAARFYRVFPVPR